jgi:hypothetical protein
MCRQPGSRHRARAVACPQRDGSEFDTSHLGYGLARLDRRLPGFAISLNGTLQRTPIDCDRMLFQELQLTEFQ